MSCGENSNNKNQSDSTSDTTDTTTLSFTDTLQIIDPTPYPGDSLSIYFEYSDSRAYYGFQDKNGKVIIPAKFEIAGDFYRGQAPVVYKGKHGFCDTSGTIVAPLIGYEFVARYNELGDEYYLGACSEGFYGVVNEEEKYGFVNSKNELIVECIYTDIQGFTEGKALVAIDYKYGYVDTRGKLIIDTKYEGAYSFHDSLAAVVIDGKIGFINIHGKLVIAANYTNAHYFNEGLCVVTKSEDYTNFFYIDKTGKTVIAGPFEDAATFEGEETVVLKRGKCKIIDKTGKVLRSGGEDCFVGC